VSEGGVFTADSSGNLQFRVNDAPLHNNSGSFDLLIFTSSTTLTVPGSAGWVDSGVMLRAGQTFSVEASGSVTIWPTCNEFCGTVEPTIGIDCSAFCPALTAGPAGSVPIDGFVPSADPYFVLPGANMVALLARIGGGTPFVVGAGGSFVADGDGALQFTVNEDGRHLGDETGEFTVTVVLDG
jgi:hypothetical protein